MRLVIGTDPIAVRADGLYWGDWLYPNRPQRILKVKTILRPHLGKSITPSPEGYRFVETKDGIAVKLFNPGYGPRTVWVSYDPDEMIPIAVPPTRKMVWRWRGTLPVSITALFLDLVSLAMGAAGQNQTGEILSALGFIGSGFVFLSLGVGIYLSGESVKNGGQDPYQRELDKIRNGE